VVSGKIDGSISTLEFTNRRGEPAKALRMRLKGNNNASTRVVLWGKDESSLPNVISHNAKVSLLGVRTKQETKVLKFIVMKQLLLKLKGSKRLNL